MRSYLPGFKVTRRTVIIFWLIVILMIAAVYFFAPRVFYHVTQQNPYQETPFINTPQSHTY